MAFTRRDFLQRGGLFLGLGMLAPAFVTRAVEAAGEMPLAGTASSKTSLVVIQLGGGNDGLNTVVPYADKTYYSLRPTLAVAQGDVLPVSGAVGLHPGLAALKPLYDSGSLAIMQGVGYPNPNRSHFRSTDIWTTAEPDTNGTTGWLGRYIDAQCCGTTAPNQTENDLEGVQFGNILSKALWTQHAMVPAVGSLQQFRLATDPHYPTTHDTRINTFRQIYSQQAGTDAYEGLLTHAGLAALDTSDVLTKVAGGYKTTIKYGTDPFSQSLRQIAQLIHADLGTRVYYASLGSFDTHANERRVHDTLLKTFADGMSAFTQDLQALGKSDQVAMMTFSEFGRRVKENAGNGTDHGTAAPMFLLGSKLKGGLYGATPSLTDLDTNGDLKFGIDFRQVYSTLLQDWLGADAPSVLDGNSYASLGVVQSS
ncbi:MAG TPA: DUF1501 domain-containing protein [Chloroflexota bacterium]